MIKARTSRRKRDAIEINIAPLIDLVFLLLIFFITSASFVKQTGIDVKRPVAETAKVKKAAMVIGVSRDGGIFLEGREIDIRSVRAYIERFLAQNPKGNVIIVADKDSKTGVVIKVVDQCRLGGAKNVSIAAKRGNFSP